MWTELASQRVAHDVSDELLIIVKLEVGFADGMMFAEPSDEFAQAEALDHRISC